MHSAFAPTWLCAMTAGILLGYAKAPLLLLALAWGAWVASLCACWPAVRLSQKRRRTLAGAALVMLALSFGFHSIRRVDGLARTSVARHAGSTVRLVGVVRSVRPEADPFEFVLDVERVEHPEGEWRAHADGRVRVRQTAGRDAVPRGSGEQARGAAWAKLRAGQTVSATVSLELASPPMNPGEPDYRMIMLQQGVHALGRAGSADVQVVNARARSPVAALAEAFRGAMVRAIDSTLAGRERDLLIAMMYGDSSVLDASVLEAFRASGISHLLAASGLHVGLVAGLCLSLAKMARLSPHASVAASTAAAGIYAVSAGWRPSVVRAWMMLAMAGAARSARRSADPLQVICISASIQLAASPLLLWNVGFQMSYAAVAALFFVVPHLASRIPRGLNRAAERLVRSFCLSFGIQLVLWPLLVNVSSRLGLLGPAANLIATPLASAALTSGLVGSSVWCVLPRVGHAINRGVQVLLSILIRWAEFCAGFRVAHIAARTFKPVEIAAYYAALAVLLWCLSDRFRRRRCTRFIAARPWLAPVVAFAAIAWAIVAPCVRPLEVVFLSVGQGDAIFIRTPSGHNVLVDAGTEFAGGRYVAPYLARLGVRRLDLVAFTHEHQDHIGGMRGLAGAVRVESILVPAGYESASIDEAIWALESSAPGMPPLVQTVGAGDMVGVGSVALEILNPLRVESGGLAKGRSGETAIRAHPDPNEGSMVMRVRCGELGLLLCADAGGVFERRIAADPRKETKLRADVIKVGHHGSAGSTSAQFLRAVGARLAVISVGKNSYNHPAAVTLERIASLDASTMRTDQDGAVRIRYSPSLREWTVHTMRDTWGITPMFRELQLISNQ